MTNFQVLIQTIRARKAEYTLPWIANRCGVGYSTIQQLSVTKGRQPLHNLGQKLIELEAETREQQV